MCPSADGPSAATRIVGVMGDPVSHSLSPLIHNTAFRSLALDWVCVGFHTPSGFAEDAVRGMSALGIRGMSVTMPHKQAVIGALDGLSSDAAVLGAVNCIQVDDGRLVGHNTDGVGFVAGLNHDFAVGPEGMDCVVLGAGGAARSVILALARSGASRITVVNRSEDAAARAAELAEVARVGTTDDISGCDLVVNATPVGMDMSRRAGTDSSSDGDNSTVPPMPCDPRLLGPDHLVVDLIYQPQRTDWLAAASRSGARTSNGLSMLVHQAAVAFELWTGRQAPVGDMSNAVERFITDGS